MPSHVKFTAAQIVRASLAWALESIDAMIQAHHHPEGGVIDPEHVAELRSLRKQMADYQQRRFGPLVEPTDGTIKIDARTRKPV